MLNKDLELAEISSEIETLFNSVMSTVVDYFEEALTEQNLGQFNSFIDGVDNISTPFCIINIIIKLCNKCYYV